MWLYAAVFLSDLFIAFFSVKFYFAMNEENRKMAVIWGLLLDFCINTTAIGLSVAHWSMMVPSLLGGGIGTFFSMGLPRRKQDS